MSSDRDALGARLTAVLILSELLLDGEYGPLEAGQQEAVQKLLDAAQDVNKILHASQITFSLD